MSQSNFYDVPVENLTIFSDQLKDSAEPFQVEVMRVWFHQNFQDPVHECPYNGREGGYAYIHGGPYDAEEELFSEFGEILSAELITQLAEELEIDCSEWSGIPKREDYDEYLFDLIVSTIDPILRINESIEKLQGMLSIEVDAEHEQVLLQMIYVNLITSLEAFLSDFFIGHIDTSDDILRSFVESNPEFKEQKFSLDEIFNKHEGLRKHVTKYLLDLMWHNLPKISKMFKATFGINFSNSMDPLMKAIHIRHDLVHRSGKTKSGELHTIEKRAIDNLIVEIRKLIVCVESYQRPRSEF